MNEWSRTPETCADVQSVLCGDGAETCSTVGIGESGGQARSITVSYITDSQTVEAVDSSSNTTRDRLKILTVNSHK